MRSSLLLLRGGMHSFLSSSNLLEHRCGETTEKYGIISGCLVGNNGETPLKLEVDLSTPRRAATVTLLCGRY